MGVGNKCRTLGTGPARFARVSAGLWDARLCLSWVGLVANYALVYNDVGRAIPSSQVFKIPSFTILVVGISEPAIGILYLFSLGLSKFGANLERGLQWVATRVRPDSRAARYYE